MANIVVNHAQTGEELTIAQERVFLVQPSECDPFGSCLMLFDVGTKESGIYVEVQQSCEEVCQLWRAAQPKPS